MAEGASRRTARRQSMTTWAGVTAQRMRRHGLAPPYAAGTPFADVTATICGVHAQVLSAGEVSLALRVEGATRADVRRALWEERSLVKTFGPRGTVHLLPARDLARWCAALSEVPRHTPFADGVRLLGRGRFRLSRLGRGGGCTGCGSRRHCHSGCGGRPSRRLSGLDGCRGWVCAAARRRISAWPAAARCRSRCRDSARWTRCPRPRASRRSPGGRWDPARRCRCTCRWRGRRRWRARSWP